MNLKNKQSITKHRSSRRTIRAALSIVSTETGSDAHVSVQGTCFESKPDCFMSQAFGATALDRVAKEKLLRRRQRESLLAQMLLLSFPTADFVAY